MHIKSVTGVSSSLIRKMIVQSLLKLAPRLVPSLLQELVEAAPQCHREHMFAESLFKVMVERSDERKGHHS